MLRRLALLFFGVLAPLMVFAAMAEQVWARGGMPLDEPLLLAIHRHASRMLDLVMILFTILGAAPSVIAFSVGVIALMWKRTLRRDRVFFLTALGGAAGLNLVVKYSFHRARPSLWVSPAPEFDYGFPSGHAMVSMTVAIALIALTWGTRWRWPVVAWSLGFALVVAFSRLYLGVHYPSDILGAWTAAIVWVTGAHAIVYATANRRDARHPNSDPGESS